jgi:hypothetical protein
MTQHPQVINRISHHSCSSAVGTLSVSPPSERGDGGRGPMARIPGTNYSDAFIVVRHEGEMLVSPNVHEMNH